MYFRELGFTKDFAWINIRELGLTKVVTRIVFREMGLTKDILRINSRELGLTKDITGISFRKFGLPRISRKTIFANATSTVKPRKGSRHWFSEKVVRQTFYLDFLSRLSI